MDFIKRASLYCARQKFKTAVLFLVLTITAAFILTGIAVRDASAHAQTNVQKAIGGRIMIEIDMNGHMSQAQKDSNAEVSVYNGDYITNDMVRAIKSVEGVTDCNVEEDDAYWGAPVNFKYISSGFDAGTTPYGDISPYTSTLSSEKCKAFTSGKYKLVSGRHLNTDDKYACLISKEVADLNKIKAGDKIQLYSLDLQKTTEFEVVGIFDGTEGLAGGEFVWDMPANRGFVASAGIEEMCRQLGEAEGYTHLDVFAQDPVSIDNVRDRIAALPQMKGKTLKLSVDTDSYDAVSSPLGSLHKLVNVTIVIIAVVSAVILTLLLTIRIRGRKKEIGILLCLGKSKTNIILQIFTETIMVAVLAFGAAVPLSCLTADKTGRFIAARASENVGELNVVVNSGLILPMCLIGLLLIALAVTASSWTVVRCKPRDILTKMS